MTKNKALLATVSVLILVLATVAGAQPGSIGQNFLVKPKAGQEMQWEAAYKEHLKWHEENNDSWNWNAYQIMSGPEFGKYMIRSGGHEWSDFDELGDKMMHDGENFYETAGKYTESVSVTFDRVHMNLRRVPEGSGPYSVYEFTTVKVKPSMAGDFLAVVAKYHAAFEKTNSPARYATVSVESGSRVGDFMFVGLHKGYASLEQDPDTMMKMMEDVYGRQEAAKIEEDFNACVEEMYSHIAILREDLTYRAPETTSSE